MAVKIQRVAYFHTTVQDRPGEAYRMLSQLSRAGVNLLAFSAIPTGGGQTQLMIFPEEEARLVRAAAAAHSAVAVEDGNLHQLEFGAARDPLPGFTERVAGAVDPGHRRSRVEQPARERFSGIQQSDWLLLLPTPKLDPATQCAPEGPEISHSHRRVD